MTLRTPFGDVVVALTVHRYPRSSKRAWGCVRGHYQRRLGDASCRKCGSPLYRGALLAEKREAFRLAMRMPATPLIPSDSTERM